jgi:hypothetical protein
MKARRNRHGRKDQSRRGRTGWRSGRSLRWAAIFAALCSLALGAVPAIAGTGGVGAVSSEGAAAGASSLEFSSPMRSAGATWYGPGLYGNHTACGQVLRRGTIGVAHRTLPCGTTIKFSYHGQTLVTKVIDRGPYTRGNDFDLTNGARLALDFEGVGRVRYAVAIGSAKR